MAKKNADDGRQIVADGEALAAARVLQGLGASAIMSVNTALIRYLYPPHRLGRGLGQGRERAGERDQEDRQRL